MDEKGSLTAEELSQLVGVSVILGKERYVSVVWHRNFFWQLSICVLTIFFNSFNILGLSLQDFTVELGYLIGYRIHNLMQFSVPMVQNNRNFLVYIGFRIYRVNFAVRKDPIYPSSNVFYVWDLYLSGYWVLRRPASYVAMNPLRVYVFIPMCLFEMPTRLYGWRGRSDRRDVTCRMTLTICMTFTVTSGVTVISDITAVHVAAVTSDVIDLHDVIDSQVTVDIYLNLLATSRDVWRHRFAWRHSGSGRKPPIGDYYNDVLPYSFDAYPNPSILKSISLENVRFFFEVFSRSFSTRATSMVKSWGQNHFSCLFWISEHYCPLQWAYWIYVFTVMILSCKFLYIKNMNLVGIRFGTRIERKIFADGVSFAWAMASRRLMWRIWAWRAWHLSGRWQDGGRQITVASRTRRRSAPVYAQIPDLICSTNSHRPVPVKYGRFRTGAGHVTRSREPMRPLQTLRKLWGWLTSSGVFYQEFRWGTFQQVNGWKSKLHIATKLYK